MTEQELCKKRLLDLSNQAAYKDIVTFSDFLNLNEQNIFHTTKRDFPTKYVMFGGYEGAERQMIAFIPDALCYEWEFPIVCLKVQAKYPKFAEELSHRDLLGSLMSLGIERSLLGDFVCKNQVFYIFCDESMASYIEENLSKVRHTVMDVSRYDGTEELASLNEFEERFDMIASNRLDCIIAKAYHFSRSEASEMLFGEKVFVNGKCIANCNHACMNDDIISVRGHGRFIFQTDNSLSKKGKLKVRFQFYK